jgi:probable F420-dependent oxidoreductase
MKLGLFNLNMGPCGDPATAVRVAQAAEAAGFDSLWVGEHVVLPEPQAPPSPLPPRVPILDPIVTLTYLAAHTKHVKLGTGIIILPQRNPLVLAKELASLDVISGGRLIFGIGVGYLKPEFDALGIPFTSKGARTVDYLDAMLAIWTQDEPRYQGRFASFGGVQAFPRPAQKPHPPIVFGGHTPEAFRRAVRHGSGWYGFFQDVDATARCIAGLEEAARELGRAGGLAGFEIDVTPSGPLDLDTVRRYADLGVHRLIPFRMGGGEKEQLEFVAQMGDTIIGRA